MMAKIHLNYKNDLCKAKPWFLSSPKTKHDQKVPIVLLHNIIVIICAVIQPRVRLYLFISPSSIKLKDYVLFQLQPSFVMQCFKDAVSRSSVNLPHPAECTKLLISSNYLHKVPPNTHALRQQTRAANDEAKSASRPLCLFTQKGARGRLASSLFSSTRLSSPTQHHYLFTQLISDSVKCVFLLEPNDRKHHFSPSLRLCVGACMCWCCETCEHDESRAKGC